MIYVSLAEKGESMGTHKEQSRRARTLLLAGLRLEYGLQQLPEMVTDPLGKPRFAREGQIYFNYSHCRAGLMCGIAEQEIGVDLEAVREYSQNFARRVCHPAELEALAEQREKNLALTKLWVAKEAYWKCRGTGLRSDLRALDLSEILQGDLRLPDGGLMRLWTAPGLCLCACSRDEKALQWKKMAV